MRIEADENTNGLHVEDKRWPAAWFHDLESHGQEFRNQSAELPKTLATIAKVWPNQIGDGEHTMREGI